MVEFPLPDIPEIYQIKPPSSTPRLLILAKKYNSIQPATNTIWRLEMKWLLVGSLSVSLGAAIFVVYHGRSIRAAVLVGGISLYICLTLSFLALTIYQIQLKKRI